MENDNMDGFEMQDEEGTLILIGKTMRVVISRDDDKGGVVATFIGQQQPNISIGFTPKQALDFGDGIVKMAMRVGEALEDETKGNV